MRAKDRTPTDKLQVNLAGMVVAIVGLLIVAYYGVVAFSSQDLFWFKQGFKEHPTLLVIYHNGQRTELKQGQAGFDDLAEAVRSSLDQGVMNPLNLGFSADSLADAYNLYVTVEVFFDHPVKLHAPFNTGHPTQILFPITGRHSDLNVALLGKEGQYLSGPPRLKTIQPIKDALYRQGFLQ